MCAQSLSLVQFCNPMDSSPPGSSVHGVLQARLLEQMPFPTPGTLPNPGTEPTSLVSPALAFMTLFRFLVGINTWNCQRIRVKADEAKY